MAGNLTDTKIKSLKYKDKTYTVADGQGLTLYVTSTGSKLWRFRYRFNGKPKILSMGAYPAVSLADARQKLLDAKKLLDNGVDPAQHMQKEREAKKIAAQRLAATFESLAREWYEIKTKEREPKYRKQILSRLENSLFPACGHIPISELKPLDILPALRLHEAKGHIETAHRVGIIAGQVCRYAQLLGLCEYNAAANIGDALLKAEQRHHAVIETVA